MPFLIWIWRFQVAWTEEIYDHLANLSDDYADCVMANVKKYTHTSEAVAIGEEL